MDFFDFDFKLCPLTSAAMFCIIVESVVNSVCGDENTAEDSNQFKEMMRWMWHLKEIAMRNWEQELFGTNDARFSSNDASLHAAEHYITNNVDVPALYKQLAKRKPPRHSYTRCQRRNA